MNRKIVSLFAHYFGILFGISFVAFLGFALWYAVLGPQSEENLVIAYAFYSLILSASFQLVSFLTNRNIPDIPSASQNRARSYTLICISVLVLVVTSGIMFAYQTASTSHSILPVSPSSSPISARVFYTRIIPEPLNETIVSFGILANGSEPPYTYTAKWSDNFSQTNNYGTFSRNFTQGEEIPLSATVVVTSASNKSVIVQVRIAPETSSTSSTSTESTSSIEFLETGLPASQSWSVQLNDTVKSSHNDSIVFIDLKYDHHYNFTVGYQFDGNFDSVFNFTPRTGVITINEKSYVQRVNFTTISSDQLVTPYIAPAFSSENGSNFLSVSYLSDLPAPINATVVAAINSSSGQIVAIPTTEVILKPGSSTQSLLYITTLEPGTYYATIYVLSSGETISPKTNLTFSIPP